MPPGSQLAMTGVRKAAILLVLLGDEAASFIYRSLPPEDVQSLTQEIAELDYIAPETASNVLQEYHRLTLTQDYLTHGGTDYATKLLIRAFGEDGAKELLDQVLQLQENSARNFDTLQKADPQQLAKFIEGEHPQTIALVLAHLGPRSAAALLALLPDSVRAQSVRRLAELQQFSPEMVGKISVVLHRKLQSLGEQSRRAYGGVKAVADLLNRMPPDSSRSILEAIEQEEPQIAVSVRNLMFTFEDFLLVPEASIRELLAHLDKRQLALAMKGAPEELKSHFFKCLSSRAIEMLKEDMDALGPIRVRDVQQAQVETVAVARKLEAEGKLELKANTEEALVV